MSMNVSPTTTTTVKHRTKDGHVENVACPLSIQLYNSYMGGVDRADHSVATTMFGWSPTSFIGLSFWI